MYDENTMSCVTDASDHKVWVVNTSCRTGRYVVAIFGDGFLKQLEGITTDRAEFVLITYQWSFLV